VSPANIANLANTNAPRQVAFTVKIVGHCNRVRSERLVSLETSDKENVNLNQLRRSVKIFVVY
jgi:hypothetical protein